MRLEIAIPYRLCKHQGMEINIDQHADDEIRPNEGENDSGDVFCIGSCTVTNKLRMEDDTKSIQSGQDVVIGLTTKHRRSEEESCAICYYDSEAQSADSDLEREISRTTVVPVGRYAKLCICTEVEPIESAVSADAELLAIPVPICSHSFHTACIYKWIKTDNGGFSCPICRGGLEKQKIRSSDVPPLYAAAPEYVVHYWPNGKIKSEHFEVNKIKHGVSKSFTNTGQLESKCTYVNGRKTGTEEHYYPESITLKSTVEFLDDVKHGLCQRFATDGKIIGESHWVNGKRSGRNVEWYTVNAPDGTPQMCNLEHHLDGEKHGIFMKWAFSGKLTMYGVYNMGERNGRFCAWYEQTGALRLKEYYIDGIRDGRAVEYYDADPSQIKNFDDQGNIKGFIKEISWFKHGLRVGEYRSYWSNGQRKIQTEYNDIGQEDGVHKEWNRFGKMCKLLYYESGQLDGVCHTFEPTGHEEILTETSTYKAGVLHGLYVQRYKGFGNPPKLIRLFKNGSDVLTRCYTRQGRLIWEKLPDGSVNNQIQDDTLHIKHKPKTRPHFSFR